MKRSCNLFPFFAFVISVAFFSASAQAADATADIEILDVKFTNDVRPHEWTQCAIRLKASANTHSEASNPDFVDNVKITLSLGYKNQRKAGEFFFYQSSVTLVTIEKAKDRTIAFYLPWEIAERDNLKEDPDFWLIQIEVDGKELDPHKDHMSRSLFPKKAGDLVALNSFKSKSFSETDGILVPAHRSPYGYASGGNELPAVIWKEKE